MVSLAVKYRPNEFDDIVAQNSIIKILNRQLETKSIKNTYLFCGASGCGKTTTARAFAKRINNGVGSPIEIDAASNNGVDNVKQIVKAAAERSIDSVYKVYIIDEAHMITTAGWNAFLKCIEEPPTYTVFIFCTTDPQKIPATILNRCMRFNFQRIASNKICERLEYICKKENFTNYYDACDYISRISNNQMRDAICTLEKCAGYSDNLSLENVMEALGTYSYDVFFDLINNLIDGNCKEVVSILNHIYTKGNDVKFFVDQFLSFCLDVSKYALLNDCSITHFPVSYENKLKMCTNFDNAYQYYSYIINSVLSLKEQVKNDSDPRTLSEIRFLQMCRCQ